MAPDDEDEFEDDLYDDEFDFVDDEDDDLEDESDFDSAGDEAEAGVEPDKPAPREPVAKQQLGPRQRRFDDEGESRDEPGEYESGGRNSRDRDARELEREPEPVAAAEPVEEYREPPPLANYRVHVYEQRQYKRTIERPFTAEDAEAFASEYNRTSKPYGRFAVTGKDDVKPKKSLDER